MKLKRIMLLIMCAVLITIGGVYATWNYAKSPVAPLEKTVSPVLAPDVSDTPAGEITIIPNNLNILIDDMGDDKIADLNITGKIVVKFTPKPDAAPDILLNGINLNYEISGLTNLTYQNAEVFKFTTATGALAAPKKEGTNFIYEIPAADVSKAIGLNTAAPLRLPHKVDYDNFSKALTAHITSKPVLKVTIKPDPNTVY